MCQTLFLIFLSNTAVILSKLENVFNETKIYSFTTKKKKKKCVAKRTFADEANHLLINDQNIIITRIKVCESQRYSKVSIFNFHDQEY